MSRPRNAMTRTEAQAADKDTRISPREWEKRVEGLLRCNGWEFHHERDRAGGAKNNARKRGFPDYLAWKTYNTWKEIPPVLLEVCRLDRPGAIQARFPSVTITGYVECKTGRGEPSAVQLKWIEAARKCPGMFGIIVWPTDRRWLISLLGGKEPLR